LIIDVAELAQQTARRSPRGQPDDANIVELRRGGRRGIHQPGLA